MSQMEAYCTANNLNTQHRLIIYKSIIRSQIDYGLPVMFINKKTRETLDKDQNYALKRIMKIDKAVEYQTILSVLDILSVSNRIDKLKMSLFYKLSKTDPKRSLAGTVFNHLWNNPMMSKVDIDKLQLMAEFHKIMNTHNLSGLFDINNN